MTGCRVSAVACALFLVNFSGGAGFTGYQRKCHELSWISLPALFAVDRIFIVICIFLDLFVFVMRRVLVGRYGVVVVLERPTLSGRQTPNSNLLAALLEPSLSHDRSCSLSRMCRCLAVKSGGYVSSNSLRVIIAVWLTASIDMVFGCICLQGSKG